MFIPEQAAMVKKAFTLIELLVVVVIIGILSTIGLIAYKEYTAAAKIALAKENFRSVVSFIRAENAKCKLNKSATWMSYAQCSQAQTKQWYYVMFGNYINTFDLAKKALPNIKNPYGRIHPYTKSDLALGTGRAWSEPGEIGVHLNSDYLGSGKFGLYLTSPAAEFRQGSNTKLFCSDNPYLEEKDPNCLREFVEIIF